MNDDAFINATCAVLINGSQKGTAWLVSEFGHLVTAGHIFKDTKLTVQQIQIRFGNELPLQVSLLKLGYDKAKAVDFAILQLNRSELSLEHRPLSVSFAPELKEKSKIRAYGFGVTLEYCSAGIGEYIGIYSWDNNPNYRLFEIKSAELGEQGYSGAAMYSSDLNAVVALQISMADGGLSSHRDTILAMPLYRVASEWNSLIDIAFVSDDQNSIDELILTILYEYYRENPGRPELPVNDLFSKLAMQYSNVEEVMNCLWELKRDKGYLDFSVTMSARAGLVWITSTGIRAVRNWHDTK